MPSMKIKGEKRPQRQNISNQPTNIPQEGTNSLNYDLQGLYKLENFSQIDVIENTFVPQNSTSLISTSSSLTSIASTKVDNKTLPIGWKIPKVSFTDFVAHNEVLIEVCKNLLHLSHSHIYKSMGISPSTGLLIHGPPGTGKTLLAEAIAGEFKWPFLKITGSEIISSITGAAEKKIRNIFKEAISLYSELNELTFTLNSNHKKKCVVLFIDEIDALTPKRDMTQKEMEKRIITQLNSCIDEIAQNKDSGVIILAATNQIDLVDPSVRRSGRMDRDIVLGMPNETCRYELLKSFCSKMNLESHVNLEKISKNTPGFVSADLKCLIREATISAISRTLLARSLIFQDNYDNISQHDILNQHLNLYLNSLKDSNSSLIETSPNIKGSIVTPLSRKFATNIAKEPEAQLFGEKILTKSFIEEIKNESIINEKRSDNSCVVGIRDFDVALRNVVPSCKREGFFTVAISSSSNGLNTDDFSQAWDVGIGAMYRVKRELTLCIRAAVKYPLLYARFGLGSGSGSTGVLLVGPPGCGKTLVARAIARESSLNFIAIAGPELLNMYVGETERAIRRCFTRAKDSAPCLIFFDEIDSICPHRGSGAHDGSSSSENSSSRIVNQLLTEMDGIDSRQGVFVMGATNRIDVIDKAILRPGRFDKIFNIDLPDSKERADILRVITHTQKFHNLTTEKSNHNGSDKQSNNHSHMPLYSDEIDFDKIADDPRCQGFSGADLSALVKEASRQAVKHIVEFKEKYENYEAIKCAEILMKKRKTMPLEDIEYYSHKEKIENMIQNPTVNKKHFEIALNVIKPSVSIKERNRYQNNTSNDIL